MSYYEKYKDLDDEAKQLLFKGFHEHFPNSFIKPTSSEFPNVSGDEKLKSMDLTVKSFIKSLNENLNFHERRVEEIKERISEWESYL